MIYNTIPIKTQLVFTLPGREQAVLDVTGDKPDVWEPRLREMAPKAKSGAGDRKT